MSLLKYIRAWFCGTHGELNYARGRLAAEDFLAGNPGKIDLACWRNGAEMDLALNPDDRFARAVLNTITDYDVKQHLKKIERNGAVT